MSHAPHELAEDFPNDLDRIHELKVNDAHFRKLFDEYHEVNARIHRSETKIDPMDQYAEEELRKQRLRIKDEIAAMLRD